MYDAVGGVLYAAQPIGLYDAGFDGFVDAQVCGLYEAVGYVVGFAEAQLPATYGAYVVHDTGL